MNSDPRQHWEVKGFQKNTGKQARKETEETRRKITITENTRDTKAYSHHRRNPSTPHEQVWYLTQAPENGFGFNLNHQVTDTPTTKANSESLLELMTLDLKKQKLPLLVANDILHTQFSHLLRNIGAVTSFKEELKMESYS